MKGKTLHPKRLACFAEVFKCGSLKAAADRLNMVQAGIGRQIQLLEQELGVLLFEREKRWRGMVPTEAAQILYDHYGRYCDWQEKMEAAVPREPTEKGKVINAGRLFYFSQVFQHGSINAVADRLNRVQAGIGRQIQLLEQELGVRLFERGTNGRGMVTGGQGRGMVPTEAAEILYDYYRKYRDWQDKMEAAIEEWRSMKRGSICIVVPNAYSDILFDDVMRDFFTKYPHLKVRVEEVDTCSQVESKLLEDEAHLGIVSDVSSIINPDIYCHMREPLSIRLLVNKGHPFASKTKVSFKEAVCYPLALPPASSRLWKMLEPIGYSANLRLASAFISGSASCRKKFAYYGLGGTFMSDLVGRQEIKASRLNSVEVEHPAFTSLELRLIVRRNKPLSPAVNQLIRLLASKLPISVREAIGQQINAIQ